MEIQYNAKASKLLSFHELEKGQPYKVAGAVGGLHLVVVPISSCAGRLTACMVNLATGNAWIPNPGCRFEPVDAGIVVK